MKKSYYIDYPQEHVEGQAHTYRCLHCKVLTTTVNGSIEGHLISCEYQFKLESEGFEKNETSNALTSASSDEVD